MRPYAINFDFIFTLKTNSHSFVSDDVNDMMVNCGGECAFPVIGMKLKYI